MFISLRKVKTIVKKLGENKLKFQKYKTKLNSLSNEAKCLGTLMIRLLNSSECLLVPVTEIAWSNYTTIERKKKKKTMYLSEASLRFPLKSRVENKISFIFC